MPGSKAPRFAVEVMNDGEILVRGTLDPHEALKVAFSEEWDDLPHDFDDALFETARPREGIDTYQLSDKAINALADLLFVLLDCAHCQYWRKIPCHPSSYSADNGWAYEVRPAEQGKSGAFPGVMFVR